MNVIHDGTYTSQTNLMSLVPQITYDNIIISPENVVNKGILNKDYTKSLLERGFTLVVEKKNNKTII
jgi:hypothetical protein